MTVSVMLVDDDENILTSVSMLLETEGFAVKGFTDGMSGLISFDRENYDLVILDIKVPRMDGVELLKKIREKSDIPVIFLTSKDDESDEAAGLSLGADDYVTKPFSQMLLLERIKAVLRRAESGKKTGSDRDKLCIRGSLTLDSLQHVCHWRGKEILVTVTEFLIIEALIKRPGHVKTRDSLMDAAYHEDIYVDDRTIDSHIKRLRKKFRAADPDFNCIHTLYGVGYKWEEPAEQAENC